MRKIFFVLCIGVLSLAACSKQECESDSLNEIECESNFNNWSESRVSEELEEISATSNEPTEEVPSKEGKYETGFVKLTEDEMLERFYDKFYGGDLSSEKIEEVLNVRGENYCNSCYYEEITYYWENIRGVRDIANLIEPLYFTDMKYYTAEEFDDSIFNDYERKNLKLLAELDTVNELSRIQTESEQDNCL